MWRATKFLFQMRRRSGVEKHPGGRQSKGGQLAAGHTSSSGHTSSRILPQYAFSFYTV